MKSTKRPSTRRHNDKKENTLHTQHYSSANKKAVPKYINKEFTQSFNQIIQKNILKYETTTTKYNIYIINSIIFDQRNHIVTEFKNYLLWDESSEFLKRYYKKKESTDRIPKIADYYERYTLFPPVYFGLDGLIILIMNRWVRRKKKYLEYVEDQEDEINENKNKKKNWNFEPIIRSTMIVNSQSYSSNINLTKNTLELTKYDNDSYLAKEFRLNKKNRNLTTKLSKNNSKVIQRNDRIKHDYLTFNNNNSKNNNNINNNNNNKHNNNDKIIATDDFFENSHDNKRTVSFTEIMDDLSSHFSIINFAEGENKVQKKTLKQAVEEYRKNLKNKPTINNNNNNNNNNINSHNDSTKNTKYFITSFNSSNKSSKKNSKEINKSITNNANKSKAIHVNSPSKQQNFISTHKNDKNSDDLLKKIKVNQKINNKFGVILNKEEKESTLKILKSPIFNSNFDKTLKANIQPSHHQCNSQSTKDNIMIQTASNFTRNSTNRIESYMKKSNNYRIQTVNNANSLNMNSYSNGISKLKPKPAVKKLNLVGLHLRPNNHLTTAAELLETLNRGSDTTRNFPRQTFGIVNQILTKNNDYRTHSLTDRANNNSLRKSNAKNGSKIPNIQIKTNEISNKCVILPTAVNTIMSTNSNVSNSQLNKNLNSQPNLNSLKSNNSNLNNNNNNNNNNLNSNLNNNLNFGMDEAFAYKLKKIAKKKPIVSLTSTNSITNGEAPKSSNLIIKKVESISNTNNNNKLYSKKHLVLGQFTSKKDFGSLNAKNNVRDSNSTSLGKKSKNQKINLNFNLNINFNINFDKKNKKAILTNKDNKLRGSLTDRNKNSGSLNKNNYNSITTRNSKTLQSGNKATAYTNTLKNSLKKK